MADKKYSVGYRKPPKHTQFKRGQSGNPKGRPKSVKNLSTDLEEELSEKVLVSEAGQQLTTTKQRAMIKTLFAKALTGDTRSANVLIGLILGLEQTRIAAEEAESAVTEEDRVLLAAYRDHLLSEVGVKSEETEHE